MMHTRRSDLKNERGSATVETLPLLLIFVMLISYTLGAFGVIHTGILHSISARTYAFETFRNRANLTYFRDIPGTDILHYRNYGNRVHAVLSEKRVPDATFYVAERPIRIGMESATAGKGRQTASVHLQDTHDDSKVTLGKRNETVEVDPVWIRVVYGICLNNGCGD